MLGASIKNDQIYIRLDWIFNDDFDAMYYKIGEALIDFITFKDDFIFSIMEKLMHMFMYEIAKHNSPEQVNMQLKPCLKQLLHINPYLYWFGVELGNFILASIADPITTYNDFKDEYEGLQTPYDLNDGDPLVLENTSKWAAAVMITAMGSSRIQLKKYFDEITDENKEDKDLTPAQRLFLMEVKGANFLEGSFEVKYLPDWSFDSEANVDQMKKELIEHNVNIIEMTIITSIEEMMRFELFSIVKEGISVRKCKCCGKFFIPKGRSDTDYCDKTKPGETKPCSEIGAVRKYWSDKKKNPVYIEFQKAYKRNHSRVTYKKITKPEFLAWSDEAREKRDLCDKGGMELEEFKEWLGNK